MILFPYACTEYQGAAHMASDISSIMPLKSASLVEVDTLVFGFSDELKRFNKAAKLHKTFANLHKAKSFNGAVLYAENGKIVYQNGFGYANALTRDSVKIESSFQAASVSKMFTATAIMMLKEEGKLKYDEYVYKYLPDFPYKNITVRQLLNHRSGISRYMYLVEDHWDVKKHIPNKEVYRIFKEKKPALYYTPNSRFHYCNTNYVMLAILIEKLSGEKFDDFVAKHIFKPLGMNHSLVYNSLDNPQLENPTKGHRYLRRKGAQVYEDSFLNGVTGDKNVYTSVGDLFLFDQALYNNTLVSEETLKEAFKEGSLRRKKIGRDNYGFGWRIKWGQEHIVFHFGWWKGYKSCFIRDMKKKRTLIILSNWSRLPGKAVLWEILGYPQPKIVRKKRKRKRRRRRRSYR